MVAVFLSSRRGGSVSEPSALRNQSESPLLDAQQHSCTALVPVGHALMAAAARPPSLAPWGFASTAPTERDYPGMSCGSSAAAAVRDVAHTAGSPSLQSASTTTSIPSGTEADSSGLGLARHTRQVLCTSPSFPTSLPWWVPATSSLIRQYACLHFKLPATMTSVCLHQSRTRTPMRTTYCSVLLCWTVVRELLLRLFIYW